MKVKNKDGEFEERKLEHLAFTVKQALIESIVTSIKSLSTLKKKGYKIGPLKFKSNYNVVHLKRIHNSYQIYRDQRKVKIARSLEESQGIRI